ncbi:hypothetical protein D3C71_2048930 [compost metagenome]
MFRKISTYVAAIPDSSLFGTVRSTPSTEPMTRAMAHEVRPSAIVTLRPEIIQSRYVSFCAACSRNTPQ